VRPGDPYGLADRRSAGKGHRLVHQESVGALDPAHQFRLLLHRHGAMDEPEPPFQGHRPGHARFGHAVHVRGDHRKLHFQAPAQPGSKRDVLTRGDDPPLRPEEEVVVRPSDKPGLQGSWHGCHGRRSGRPEHQDSVKTRGGTRSSWRFRGPAVREGVVRPRLEADQAGLDQGRWHRHCSALPIARRPTSWGGQGCPSVVPVTDIRTWKRLYLETVFNARAALLRGALRTKGARAIGRRTA